MVLKNTVDNKLIQQNTGSNRQLNLSSIEIGVTDFESISALDTKVRCHTSLVEVNGNDEIVEDAKPYGDTKLMLENIDLENLFSWALNGLGLEVNEENLTKLNDGITKGYCGAMIAEFGEVDPVEEPV